MLSWLASLQRQQRPPPLRVNAEGFQDLERPAKHGPEKATATDTQPGLTQLGGPSTPADTPEIGSHKQLVSGLSGVVRNLAERIGGDGCR